jgi:hypothetical protein
MAGNMAGVEDELVQGVLFASSDVGFAFGGGVDLDLEPALGVVGELVSEFDLEVEFEALMYNFGGLLLGGSTVTGDVRSGVEGLLFDLLLAAFCGYAGWLVPVVEFKVVFEAKLVAPEGDAVDEDEGRGCSFANCRTVSAATIPPIECPTRTTWTEGSTVGEGVE